MMHLLLLLIFCPTESFCGPLVQPPPPPPPAPSPSNILFVASTKLRALGIFTDSDKDRLQESEEISKESQRKPLDVSLFSNETNDGEGALLGNQVVASRNISDSDHKNITDEEHPLLNAKGVVTLSVGDKDRRTVQIDSRHKRKPKRRVQSSLKTTNHSSSQSRIADGSRGRPGDGSRSLRTLQNQQESSEGTASGGSDVGNLELNQNVWEAPSGAQGTAYGSDLWNSQSSSSVTDTVSGGNNLSLIHI